MHKVEVLRRRICCLASGKGRRTTEAFLELLPIWSAAFRFNQRAADERRGDGADSMVLTVEAV